MPVPYFDETRHVEIRFEPGWSSVPRIYADGPEWPEGSPHRYNARRLCIWYPSDPDDQRWVFDDGLLMLINLIQSHLFKEAWWRETGGREGGEWLGPEAPHDPPKDPVQEKDDAKPVRPDVPRGS